MLGFFRNVCEVDGNCIARPARSSRLVRTSASCPPLNTQRGWHAIDARGGRVLLHRDDAVPMGIRLAVWDPFSAAAAGHLELPVPILPRRPRSWNAALLCCDHHGLQDHADVPFRVVLVGTDPEGTFACVYSSFGLAAWSEVACAAQHPDPGDDGGRIARVRGALVGNTLYFLLQDRTSILKYDLATGDISVIRLPPASYSYIRWMPMVLTTTEDGGLGFAGVAGDRLHLWSVVLRPNGGALAMGFAQGRTIDLSRLPPSIVMLGFADDAGIILLATIDGLISVDQKSGRIYKLVDGGDFYRDNCIVPYVRFYTPALVTASTDEGPSADA
ncbi:unnamed protein product [Miscanthus lutarioriparius]|uniref:Uncharacterized protein n=1 Tax=Miscanthus lutarioriparius TaxID=422564 RepID=A0A811RMU6_9POAL|nr:unnamed protein product [Miscanthus lutarioriparius]